MSHNHHKAFSTRPQRGAGSGDAGVAAHLFGELAIEGHQAFCPPDMLLQYTSKVRAQPAVMILIILSPHHPNSLKRRIDMRHDLYQKGVPREKAGFHPIKRAD
ncbi:hypothetical protein [Roseovarius sp. 2305UL8-3]|uniref:hypothetical protein n=1 Tax=Roseovarius conchicola TaxID=3121636 RepID=UPI00352776E1